MELAAIERLKKIPQTYNGENLVSTLDSSFIFDWIFFILAGNEDNYKILDEFDYYINTIQIAGEK